MISTNMAAMLKDMEGVQYRSVLGHTCDQLGMCQHPRLDCSESTCHRALLDDGHVDVPLPALGGGNFWLDSDGQPAILGKPDGPANVTINTTSSIQQPHLMDVTPRPPSTGEIVWFWCWVFMSYLFCVGLGGWLWGKYGDVAVRAFWRVISGVG